MCLVVESTVHIHTVGLGIIGILSTLWTFAKCFAKGVVSVRWSYGKSSVI